MLLFFNLDWAGACRGRWVEPRLLAGWAAGFWIVWAEVRSLQCWSAASDVALVCKIKKGGSARASPVAAPMPKSVSF